MADPEAKVNALLGKIQGLYVGFAVYPDEKYFDVLYDKKAVNELQRFSPQDWVAVFQDIVMHQQGSIVDMFTELYSIRRLVSDQYQSIAPGHTLIRSVEIDAWSPVLAEARARAPAADRVMFICRIDMDRAERAIVEAVDGSPLEFQSSVGEVSKYQDRVAPSALLLAVSLAVIGIAVDTASLQRRLNTRRTVSLRAPVQVGGATAADRIEVVSGATEDMVGMPVTVPQARRVSVLAVDETAQIVTLTAKLLPVTGGGAATVPGGTRVAIGDAVNDLHFLTPDRIGASIGVSVGVTWLVLTLVQMVSVGPRIFKPFEEYPEINLRPQTQLPVILRPNP